MFQKKRIMKKEEVGLEYKGKKVKFQAKIVSEFEKGIGLMFSRKKTAKILIFKFKKPTKLRIHSLFVFFPFVAVWLDSKNKIIEKKKIKPFKLSISPKSPFSKLIEIPINKKNKKILNILDEQKI